MCQNFFIVTGGPGTGKTTLLRELTLRGFFCVEDVARKVIQEESAVDGDALPWKSLNRFIERLLVRSVDAYNQALRATQKVVFFDQGAPDYIAYAHHTKTEVPLECITEARSLMYNKKVFIAPPWKEIFCNDNERTQTFEKSVKVYGEIVQAYSEIGCKIIELPKISVEKRVDFVISHIRS